MLSEVCNQMCMCVCVCVCMMWLFVCACVQLKLVVEIELSYMNTNHPDFIGFDRLVSVTCVMHTVLYSVLVSATLLYFFLSVFFFFFFFFFAKNFIYLLFTFLNLILLFILSGLPFFFFFWYEIFFSVCNVFVCFHLLILAPSFSYLFHSVPTGHPKARIPSAPPRVLVTRSSVKDTSASTWHY